MSSFDTKQIYSLRNGNNPDMKGIELDKLLDLFSQLYTQLLNHGYFAEYFGYYTGNNDKFLIEGKFKNDSAVEYDIFMKTRKSHLLPIKSEYVTYSEDDLFDVIEYLFKYVSLPIESNYKVHDSGFLDKKSIIHTKYSAKKGKADFTEKINELLSFYKKPFILSESGEIQNKVEDGLINLVNSNIHLNIQNNDKLDRAKNKFLKHNATNEDKRDAIRELGDILEYYREDIIKKWKKSTKKWKKSTIETYLK